MGANKLFFSPAKTEFLLLGRGLLPSTLIKFKGLNLLKLVDSLVELADVARNLGVGLTISL